MKDGDGVVVLDTEFFMNLVVSVVEIVDSVHRHPLIEAGFGHAEFFFEALFLIEN